MTQPTEKTGIFDTIRQLAADQVGALQTVSHHLQELQAQNMDHARVALDENLKLMRMTWDYQVQLGNQWREMSMDMFKGFNSK
jgi:hypothetical protein